MKSSISILKTNKYKNIENDNNEFLFLLVFLPIPFDFPANIAALSIIFATQLTNLLQLSTDYLLLIAVITAVSVTGLNLLELMAFLIFPILNKVFLYNFFILIVI
ncbi:hypothetical protein EfmJHP36_25990 [Enterococcus faecium]|nr:hypothetical protein EfmJHP36_25990 [Enterococcus faecium]